MRGRSLAVRLAALLAAVVLVVLLLAGVVVNRATTRSLDETLAPGEQQRLNLAVAVVEQGLERGADGPGMERLLDQIARQSRGRVSIVDPDGTVRLEADHLRADAEPQTLTSPLSADAGGGSIEIAVPNPAAPFLRAFNAALVLVGIVAVVALLVAAAFLSDRLTRPLRQVAVAARRLGAGDLGARATGGSDAESADLAAAFNGMADRLERSELLRRRAASDLAHDLATPATVLESQIQAMVDGVVPADGAQLEKARAAAAGLSSVIAQLGELTQAEAAPLQRQPEPIALLALARETVHGLDGMLQAGHVRATVEGVAADTVADRGQLSRALRNVVANAIQHSPRGGEVRIEVGEGPELRVTDAGGGIEPEDRPFVFERFYRADRSRARPGSGIGLTVARELIVANGGEIEVESTGPDGTTFVIRFA
ncbi:MAG TPA: HAMP domain-containing sensor histidine kinase [Candidatus Limnocylindria bacterium]|jgi:signal transduction histidine kinase